MSNTKHILIIGGEKDFGASLCDMCGHRPERAMYFASQEPPNVYNNLSQDKRVEKLQSLWIKSDFSDEGGLLSLVAYFIERQVKLTNILWCHEIRKEKDIEQVTSHDIQDHLFHNAIAPLLLFKHFKKFDLIAPRARLILAGRIPYPGLSEDGHLAYLLSKHVLDWTRLQIESMRDSSNSVLTMDVSQKRTSTRDAQIDSILQELLYEDE